MGRVNIQGLGVVDIEGNAPNEQELEVFKRALELKKVDQLTDKPAEELTESYIASPAFKRLLTEAGLAIAGTIATGGLALPGLAIRGTMLARPFLTQLAKSSLGAGVGGGTGAAVAQTFDPKEDVVKEILRASTEGALAEAIGAPLVIKGGQVVSKLLGAKPKEYSSLLEGAEQAEQTLQSKSLEILRGEDFRKLRELKPDEFKKILNQAFTDEKKIAENVKAFAEKNNIKLNDKTLNKLRQTAEEVQLGLTPGIKSENRTLEIIENISQKSLIGGGAISKRYTALKDIGDLVAKDTVNEFKKQADSAQLGRFFLEELGMARGSFLATKNLMYKRVDDALMTTKGTSLKTPQIIPVENPLKKAMSEIEELYSEGVPDIIKNRLSITRKNLDAREGLYSFQQLSNLRKILVDEQASTFVAGEKQALGKLIQTVEKIFDDPNLMKLIPDEAVTALREANNFFKAGNAVFSRGVVRNLLKNAADDGSVFGKDAKAVQEVFKKVSGGDNVESTKAIFREIDAIAGKGFKAGERDTLEALIKPGGKGQAMISEKQANLLKESFRGQYLMNAIEAAESGSSQFGRFIDAKKFDAFLGKGEEKLKDYLFKGANGKALENLQNTLAFAQGDLSRLSGIPGGVFIQLKQAGAAGTLLSFGGAAGAAGVLGGIAPAAAILAAPAVASKLLLNPKFSNLIFKEQAKLVAKGENTPSKMAVLYRQIIGRMFSDGIITEQERDDVFSELDSTLNTLERQNVSTNNQASLPNVQRSNFPVINQGGGGGGQGTNTELAQALNLFSKGGIVSATKVNT
tara:strand:- start:1010 stop:3415 length:2406 start_codon:yes stop_codon:yes gene_type:complete